MTAAVSAVASDTTCRLAAWAAVVVAHALAGADLDALLGCVRRVGTHALLDLASHGEESLLDVGGRLGGCLEEGNSKAVGKFLQICVSARASHRKDVCLKIDMA